MKKTVYILMLMVLMASCKDGLLVNQYDKNVNRSLNGKNGQSGDIDTTHIDTTHSDNPINPEYETINVNGVTFRMVKVDGGTFQMGSNDGYSDEKPVHSVTLSSYYIGETEVTQALWQAVMGSNPSYFKGDNLPVEWVSWDYCQEFIKKLNQLTGKTFALPTEAQWEYAARGGNKSRGYEYSGSNNIDDVAWYYDNSSSETHPVGTKQANELGIYDMSGNVFEWCQDWYGSYPSSSQIDPVGPSTGSSRVNRGGSWYHDAKDCRSANRDSNSPGSSNSHGNLGLRLALLDEQPEEPTTEVSVTVETGKAVLNVDGTIYNLIKVDGGTFKMGQEGVATPVHSVTLSSYYICETEVTQALWQAVMGSNPSYFKGDNLPVEQVSWDNCQEFIKKLNQLTGKTFALPTEAQWEYAARGGNKSRGYEYSGSNNIDDVAWYDGNSSMQTHQVGTKMANELGLYDMSGNVWEWCQDWYGSYTSSSQTDPAGPSTGSGRVNRGGSWFGNASGCRSSNRRNYSPGSRYNFLGLRLVLLF
ncbi:MAG: formylglycine-generating enzyme family protein [Paludibacteraceae bacterium]|nr:formylglycine-generating enzyme family protein [Paludibacteraceae bacterium]